MVLSLSSIKPAYHFEFKPKLSTWAKLIGLSAQKMTKQIALEMIKYLFTMFVIKVASHHQTKIAKPVIVRHSI